jgi:hypothetical protein
MVPLQPKPEEFDMGEVLSFTLRSTPATPEPVKRFLPPLWPVQMRPARLVSEAGQLARTSEDRWRKKWVRVRY